MAVTNRGCVGLSGPPALALAAGAFLVLACRCGEGPAFEDVGRDDAPPDDVVGDARDVDASEDDAGAEEAIEGWDDDGTDGPNEFEAVPCEVSDRDVPVWERTVGECWRDDPPARDLSAEWFEPELGCEQITYGNYRMSSTLQSYDVWGDAIAFS